MSRRVTYAAGLTVTIGVLVCLAVGLILLSARASLTSGISEVRLAQASVTVHGMERSPAVQLDRAALHLERARRQFAQANDRLTVLGPLLSRLGWVPDVGDEIAASPVASHLAYQASSAALMLVQGLQPVAAQYRPAASSDPPRLQALLRTLASAHGQFHSAYTEILSAQRTRRSLPALPGRAGLTAQVRSLDRQLPRLLALSRALSLLPSLAGFYGPRTYLVAYQNQDELRATGGFIGSVALLRVRNGAVVERFQGSGLDRENYSFQSPEPMFRYNHEPVWLLRDSNWSPDFPTSAALERFFARLDLHQSTAGEIDVTPPAAADILDATGPIYAPEYRRWITSSNVAQLADFYAHWSPTPGPSQSGNQDTRRKQFIGIVAGLVLHRLEAMPVSGWLRLSTSLGAAVSHRDLLVHLDNPREQLLVAALGAAGEINPTSADYLYVVDTNLSYNKINPYVHVALSYQARLQPNGWLEARLTVRLHNAPAPGRLNKYGLGPGAGSLGGPDDYADFLRVYIPNGAEILAQSGWTHSWPPGLAYGKTMFSGYIIVPRGATRTIRIRYQEPPNILARSRGSRYRLTVQHQPGSHPDSLYVAFQDGRTQRAWKVERPVTDFSETVPITWHSVQPIPLSRSPFPTVSPGHWIEPYAYLGPF